MAVLKGKKIVNKEEYDNQIKNKEEEKNIIPLFKLKEGQVYKDELGREVIYIGKRYISKIRLNKKINKFDISNLYLKHFIVELSISRDKDTKEINHYIKGFPEILNKNIIEEIEPIVMLNTGQREFLYNKNIPINDIEDYFINLVKRDLTIACLSKNNILNPTYGFVEVNNERNRFIFYKTDEGRYIARGIKK